MNLMWLDWITYQAMGSTKQALDFPSLGRNLLLIFIGSDFIGTPFPPAHVTIA